MRKLEGIRTPTVGEYYKICHRSSSIEHLTLLERIVVSSLIFSGGIILAQDSSSSDWDLYEVTDLMKALL